MSRARRIPWEAAGVGPEPSGSLRERRDQRLAEVRIREGESFESLLKRFARRVQHEGILREIKRRRHFEKPSIMRKRKRSAKLHKSRRNTNGRYSSGRFSRS